ncbi:MAG TPA: DUF3291 domain-containing protein [Ilumatobacter sp.]|nr:DUF3291 domain-containing protein [Ilumatobacter sp.]
MIFLAVLAVATAAAGVILRSNTRAIARCGMAVAFVVAGIAHLANPTPFEQHLPSWVPGAAALVLATGVVEIALGLALALAPGRPSSAARRTSGWLTAAYLVAIFPANVYVAVAAVDVDGQPGGFYPWLRLPFQALFVAWVLWSTADSRNTGGATGHIDLPTLRLRWAPGPGQDAGRTDTSGPVAMASRLELRRLRDVPAFLAAALRLRRSFRRTPGAVALALGAAPFKRTFWTVSVWEDHAALRAYAGDQLHIDTMRRFRPAMAGSTFVDWPVAAMSRPTWHDAAQRLAASIATEVDGAQVCASPS